MRRRGLAIVGIVVVVVAVIGTWFYGYNRGVNAGSNAASADRGAFPTRAVSAGGAPGAGGFGGQGGQGNATGQAGSGSAVAGNAGGQRNQGGVTGKATKIDNGVIILQGANNANVTVNTTATTVVQTFATGTVKELKAGDFATVQGDKGSDGTYAAKSIISVGATPPTGLIPSGATGGAPGAASPGNSSGPVGRITKIDGATVTLQGFDGATITAATSGSTTIRTLQPGAIIDIKAGDALIVQGDAAGAGAYNARIIINQGTTPIFG